MNLNFPWILPLKDGTQLGNEWFFLSCLSHVLVFKIAVVQRQYMVVGSIWDINFPFIILSIFCKDRLFIHLIFWGVIFLIRKFLRRQTCIREESRKFVFAILHNGLFLWLLLDLDLWYNIFWGLLYDTSGLLLYWHPF